jgi:co-chaperonin GroES (HSP10)
MKAVNNYIVIEKIKEEPVKKNGLILSESQSTDVRYLRGKVISIGDLVQGLTNDDIIYYDRHAGHGVEYAGAFYHVIRQQDVVIVV